MGLPNPVLRIALPKGRMSEETLSYFSKKGISTLSGIPDGRELIVTDKVNNLEFLLIRSKDVGTYVEQGAADAGIIGYDLIEENGFEVFIPTALPLGECRLSVAYPAGKTEWLKKRNIRVATKYPKLASRYFFSRGFNIQIIELYGSIEIAPITGISDVIVDLVSSGQTLKANGLVEEEHILHSTARLIMNPASYMMRRARLNEIIDRLTEN